MKQVWYAILASLMFGVTGVVYANSDAMPWLVLGVKNTQEHIVRLSKTLLKLDCISEEKACDRIRGELADHSLHLQTLESELARVKAYRTRQPSGDKSTE